MKRVISFCVLLCAAAGFLMGAHRTVDGLQDDIFVTVHHSYGDPAWVEGRTFRRLDTCGEHMWWYTDHTPGDPGETKAQFHFSQEGHGFFEPTRGWLDFSLGVPGGMGMSTSGGNGLEFSDEGIGRLVNEVAERTLPGEVREESVLLSDYFDYYPLDYYANIQTEEYYLDEMYDTLRDEGTMVDWSESSASSYDMWVEYFRFPVVSGEKMKITLGKDGAGEIRELYLNMEGSEAGAEVEFSTVMVEKGMYFSPVFQDWEGNPLHTGEYVYGYGLYYIPLRELGYAESTPPWMTFDFEGLEMVYSLESTDRLLAMETSADGDFLHLLVNQGGKYVYCLFDIQSRELVSRTQIMETDADARWAFYPEQELLYLLAGGKMALVHTGVDSRTAFLTPWPEEAGWVIPEAVCYEDGVLYGLELTWHEEEGRGVCMIACNEEGLQYMGSYFTNLNSTGYHSAWLSLEWAEFVTE